MFCGNDEALSASRADAFVTINFLSGNFVFGDMSFEEAKHSISLFAQHCMPSLAHAGTQAHLELLAAA